MPRIDCLAMILAGGKGERLGSLTSHLAKPAIHFGGKYRIIDFTLSNCYHSGFSSLGVLTQYLPFAIHDYIGSGHHWNLNLRNGAAFMLPSSQRGGFYFGTADAIFKNLDFIDSFNPDHVLILSGDHIYKMDYSLMLDFHLRSNADATISVSPVPFSEASRFGIISVRNDSSISSFVEKPSSPSSNLASMGIYIFKWDRLKAYLSLDHIDPSSAHDFGKNIIPAALNAAQRLFAFRFDGYWKDVGTLSSFWQSNLDLLDDSPPINIYDNHWPILTKTLPRAPSYLSLNAQVKRSIVAENCHVYGSLDNCVLFDSVTVEHGASVSDSVLLPGAYIGKFASVSKAVIGDNAFISEGVRIGADVGISDFFDSSICSDDISLIAPGSFIGSFVDIVKNSHVHSDIPSSNPAFLHNPSLAFA